LEAVLSVPQFPGFQLQISSQQNSVIQLQFFSRVDMASPEIRSKIIAGKDINLNILLLPNYETPSKQKNKQRRSSKAQSNIR
jgi:hypothetical protein